MRPEYLAEHPHLDFVPNLAGAPANLWLLLGEAKSKCDHLANAPLLPELAAELHRVYLIRGAVATTAIEGNTLTEEEVSAFLDGTQETPRSRRYQEQEIRNVFHAIERIIADDSAKAITVDELNEYNAWVLADLELPHPAMAGSVRSHAVRVGNAYRPPDGRHLRELMLRFVDFLNAFPAELFPDSDPRHAAILKAILAHLYLVWIHPYGDGNGRTARLLEWRILHQAGIPSPAAHLLSNHYNLTRTKYYEELNQAGRTRDVNSFVIYALRGFVDGLKVQLNTVQGQQMFVTWEYLLNQIIPGQSDTDARRREIARALLSKKDPVRRSDIPDLNTTIARMYAAKTDKTLSRDLNWLLDQDLIHYQFRHGYSVNVELLLALVPAGNASKAIQQLVSVAQRSKSMRVS